MSKKLRVLTSFILVLALGSFMSQLANGASGNMLGDPDFELDDGSWEIWTWQQGDAAIESDLAIQLDGNYLRATKYGNGGAGAAQQFDAIEGDVFLIHGWVRTSVGATGECAVFTVSWGDANYVPSNNNFLRRDESTQIGEPILTGEILSWTFVQMVTLPAPAGTVTARFECFNNKDGDGDAYFDSMHVGLPLTASKQNPADGAVGVRRTPTLSWRPGAAADSHDVYFGTDFNEVSEADDSDPNVFVWNQEPNSYKPSEVLELDTTYYWRIDEVNDSNTWKGDVWRFKVASIIASHPSPADGEPEANRYSLLSWAPGADANSHDIYFGTNFNDVNDATTSDLQFKGNQTFDNTSYDPCVLELTQTYYWRIDEVNEADPNSWKGDVWSFTVSTNLLVNSGFEEGFNVDPWAEGMNPTAWIKWTWGDGWIAWRSDSGQGNDPPLAYSGDKFMAIGAWTDPPELWVAGAGMGQDIPANPGDILTASVWARTELWGVPFGGLKVEFKDAVGGTVLQFDESFNINSIESTYTKYSMTSRPAPEGTTIAEFIIQATRQGTVLFDNASVEFGPPAVAWNPNPGHGAVYVDRNADLSWKAGIDASSHDVYFGTDFNDVNNADNSWPVGGPDPQDPDVYKGSQDLGNTSYEIGVLEPTRTYYWRIDEVNGLDIWRGEIWRFTTGESSIVDDFDSYVSSITIDATWVENTGRTVITLQTAEGDANYVRDGNSMKYSYGNAFSPYYCESKANIVDLAVDPDWAAWGIKALSLWFYGQSGNSTTVNDRMYLALEDTSGNLAVVPYDGDANDVKLETWQNWNIELEDFNEVNNVDLSSIASIYIGFGDRYDYTVAGGSGIVYFDDIMLYPHRCVAALSLSQGDFTGDCVIDESDLEIMAIDWLMRDYNVVAETLSSAALVAWYEFEGNATDSSDNDNDGMLHGGVSFVAGVEGDYAIDLDGFGDYMSIPGSNTPGGAFDFNDAITVTAWIQVRAFDKWFQTVISKGDTSWRLARYLDQDRMEFACTGVSGGADPLYGNVIGSIKVNDSLWHHVAGVYDGAGVYLYVDGILDSSQEAAGAMNNNTFDVYIGANEQASERDWNGLIDDVQIYNRGLSHGEILDLMGESEIYQPVISSANLSDEEPKLFKSVNFKDYAIVAESWLKEFLFPF